MTYKEAMDRYGSDKPDVRFGFELTNLNEVVKNCGFGVFAGTVEAGNFVKAINVKDGADKFSKKGMKNLEKIRQDIWR